MAKGLKDINWLFDKYYSDNPELRRIVTVHSEQVAKKALNIAAKKSLDLDPKDIYCAAMLHDIGVVSCHAPDIKAFGDKPYLQHGLEGNKMLKENGLITYANVCSTHTGSGLTASEIKESNLPLPHEDFLPESLLEKLICYADKFFSKSGDLTREKSLDEVLSQMRRHGSAPLSRFLSLHSLFS